MLRFLTDVSEVTGGEKSTRGNQLRGATQGKRSAKKKEDQEGTIFGKSREDLAFRPSAKVWGWENWGRRSVE